MQQADLRDEKMRPLRIIFSQDLYDAIQSGGLTHDECLACAMWLVKQVIDYPSVSDLTRLEYIGWMAGVLQTPRPKENAK